MMRRRMLQLRSPLWERMDRWLRPLQARAGIAFLALAFMTSSVLLVSVPDLFIRLRMADSIEAWRIHTLSVGQQVSRAWSRRPALPDFQYGSDAVLRTRLQRDPLLVAWVERGSGRVWLREGEVLVLASGDAVEPWRSWARSAQEAGQMLWNPPASRIPQPLSEAIVALPADQACGFRRWRVGSPEVEAFLRGVLGTSGQVQVGLRRAEPSERPRGPAPVWSAYPNLQAEADTVLERHVFELDTFDDSLGEGWELVIRLNEPEREQYRAQVRRQQHQAWSLYAAMLGVSGIGLYLRYRTRQREREMAVHLSGLAHSLKTPLAVLKLRCDSVRLGGLPQPQVDAQLIRIGEEVDQLVTILESNLQRVGRHRTSRRPQVRVGKGEFQAMAADMAQAFAMEGRELVIDVDTVVCRADPWSLRTAIGTLLENALLHGSGSTTYQVRAEGRVARVRVRNEGTQGHAVPLERLGEPFLKAPEGRGQGLGLSLLLRSAEQEGWGLEFVQDPTGAFEAVFELPGDSLREPAPLESTILSGMNDLNPGPGMLNSD